MRRANLHRRRFQGVRTIRRIALTLFLFAYGPSLETGVRSRAMALYFGVNTSSCAPARFRSSSLPESVIDLPTIHSGARSR